MNFVKKIPFIKLFSSIKITVTCLSLLFILTLWGTIDQVENGLYHAQEQFFNSYFFTILGFLPFPGAQLVLWILFINLLCVALTRFVYRLSHIGILIIHFGLLTYFVAAFVTLYCVEESQLTLMEKEASNVSSSYHDWEFSVWKQDGEKKHVIAYDTKFFTIGQILDFSEYGFQTLVKEYYPNAQVVSSSRDVILNVSDIQNLENLEPNKEPEKNFPGGEFLLKIKNQKDVQLLLFGGEERATSLTIGKETYHFLLRRKRHVLPITLKLIDFRKEVHPNTEIARSYKSKVEIQSNGLNREVSIFMNNPLRYKNYTFYQASYSVDAEGRESSTLAVVKNSGRLFPYIASLLTFTGLVIHFLTMAFGSRNKVRVTQKSV